MFVSPHVCSPHRAASGRPFDYKEVAFCGHDCCVDPFYLFVLFCSLVKYPYGVTRVEHVTAEDVSNVLGSDMFQWEREYSSDAKLFLLEPARGEPVGGLR